MKVCLLSSSFPRFEGDFSGIFVYRLGEHLAQLGCEVVALVPHEYALPHQEKMGQINVYRFPYFFPRSLQRLSYGAGIATNIKHSQLARLQLPMYALSQLIALIWLKRWLQVDVINSHWIVPQGINTALLHKWVHLPHVCTIHAAGLFALERIVGGKRLARFVIQNSDHLFTVSSYIKNRLETLAEQKTNAEVLPMGIQVNQFATPVTFCPSAAPTLLFVGRLVEKKGVQYLIEAMPHVIREFPHVKLVLVGDGPLLQKLNNQISKLNLKHHTQLLGRKSTEEMPAIYKQASIVVVPSIIDQSGETEGMPVVVLEALAAGKPVVGSDVSGIPDLVKDGVNGFLAKPKSPESLADCIKHALTRLSSGELQKNAQATAAHYDWKIVAEQYVQAFRRAIAGFPTYQQGNRNVQ